MCGEMPWTRGGCRTRGRGESRHGARTIGRRPWVGAGWRTPGITSIGGIGFFRDGPEGQARTSCWTCTRQLARGSSISPHIRGPSIQQHGRRALEVAPVAYETARPWRRWRGNPPCRNRRPRRRLDPASAYESNALLVDQEGSDAERAPGQRAVVPKQASLRQTEYREPQDQTQRRLPRARLRLARLTDEHRALGDTWLASRSGPRKLGCEDQPRPQQREYIAIQPGNRWKGQPHRRVRHRAAGRVASTIRAPPDSTSTQFSRSDFSWLPRESATPHWLSFSLFP